MSRARKTAIVAASEAAMPDVASKIGDAVHAAAEGLTDVAAALCYDAATKYEGTAGEQRQIAATMFNIAQRRFGGVKYDGREIGDMEFPELEALWDKLITGRKKR